MMTRPQGPQLSAMAMRAQPSAMVMRAQPLAMVMRPQALAMARRPQPIPFAPSASSAVGDVDMVDDDGGVDVFLRKELAPWMENLQSQAVSEGKFVVECLWEVFTSHVGSTNPEEMAQALRTKVPWGQGIVGFQAIPKTSRKGTIHIAMLSFEKTSYAASGMFLNDASLLLKTQGIIGGLSSQTLAVRPRPGAKMTVFGWEPDGAVVNSTHAFVCTCAAAYAVVVNVDLPQPLARWLQNIPVTYTKHDNSRDRLLQNLVDSAVQRHANRTVQCPIFLAEELARCAIQPGFVKAFVKLYQQRMSISPGLQMPQRMEDSVVRVMGPNKTCPNALLTLKQSVVKRTWHDGPWQVGHLLSPYFPIGAPLNSSLVVEWAQFNFPNSCRTDLGTRDRRGSLREGSAQT